MNIKKIISLVLACFMLVAILAGCKKDSDEENTETDAPTEVFIGAEAICEYTIIRADNADEETVAAASKLFFELKKRFGDKVIFVTDYVKDGEEVPTDTKEILVGLTNRPESKGVRYLDYEIGYQNDRVTVNGGSAKAVAEAVDYFIANCISDDGVTVPASYAVTKTYPLENLRVDGELLKNFSVKEIEGDVDATLRAYLGEQIGIYSKSPTGNEIILKTDSKYGATELDIYLENGNLIIANSSDVGDCSLAAEYFMEQIKNMQNEQTTLAGNVSLTIDGFRTATDADIAELRAKTDARIAEIRGAANMTIPAGATVYYVSNSGNDSNNGTSPSSAWKTLDKVSSANISSGSYVCFERGGIFRGKITAKAGVTYTAYGTGDKPKLYGSPENGADPTKWKKSDKKNVWYYVGAENWKDVGTLVFNEGEACAIKAIREYKDNGDVYNWTTGLPFNNGYKDLNKDLHFYHDPSTKRLYLYSEENPGNRFNSIEFNVGYNLITVKEGVNGVTVDNLCLKYTGIHGIGANTVNDLTVQNCEFGWIGGTVQGFLGNNKYETRLGNAVEIYGGCEDYTVQNNYIYQIYDAGITHQYSGVGTTVYNHTNVLYLNNVIENCVYSIEYFVSGCEPSNPSVMTNFRIEGNHMWYASRGFCEQRPPADRSWGAHIKGRCSRTGNRATGYVIKDNIFVDGRDRLLQITSNLYNVDGSDSMPTFEGNIFVEQYGRKLGQVWQSETPDQQIDAKFDFESIAYLSERTFERSKDNEIWFAKDPL
ncbi:MAG: hypothetical protein IJZ83_08500 [Clostridia bacterium]|nr:hypothetical protein [Clostridia bacterium]